MKQFLICGFLLFASFVYFTSGSAVDERRFREGSSFSRKLRLCNLFCSLKGSRGSYNQTRCYQIPSQNAVVTDCAFICLRMKGESPAAKECKCRNRVCLPEKSTTIPDNAEQPTPEPPATTPNPETETETESTLTTAKNPTENPTQNSRRKVSKGKNGVKGQNSNNGNQSKRKP